MMSADRACIVIGGDIHSALNAVRAIGATGLQTWAMSNHRSGVAVLSASRFCSGATRLRATNPEDLAFALTELADKYVGSASEILVVTNSDRIIGLLDECRNRLDARFTLTIPRPGLCAELLDKSLSLRLAEQAGLDVPTWAVVACQDDMRNLPSFTFPVCIRPTAWSTSGTDHFKIAVCDTPEAMTKKLVSGVAGGGSYIVQDYVGDADDLEVAMVFAPSDGRTPRIWSGRKLRSSSPEGGVLAYGESSDRPDVRSALADFVAHTRFSGIGGIEFRRQGSRLWFIEFNPRVEAFHRLARVSDFDALAMLVDEWVGVHPTGPGQSQRPASMLVWPAWRERLRKHPSDAGKFLVDLFRFLLHRRRALALWSWRDPTPSIATANQAIRQFVASVISVRSRR